MAELDKQSAQTFLVDDINGMISKAKDSYSDLSVGEVSDGYHTFNELYHHRTILFATIVNGRHGNNDCWKSRKHHDGTMYDGMFIVGINTPAGQATYHCDNEYWELFHCIELPSAPEYDGHTPADAIERIKSIWRD